jgi:hypothetical protein
MHETVSARPKKIADLTLEHYDQRAKNFWEGTLTTVPIRPVPPVCAPLEIERRGPRRSLLVLRHRSETRRSRPLWFAQGALQFGGPSAPTCTQQKGRREGESHGRPGTIVRCRLFPEPRCKSPQSAVYTESTLPAYLRTAFAPRFFDRATDFIRREPSHRGGKGGGFRRDDANPLDCDLLVVDETSMVDVLLMHALVKAVPDRAAVLIMAEPLLAGSLAAD